MQEMKPCTQATKTDLDPPKRMATYPCVRGFACIEARGCHTLLFRSVAELESDWP